jgi:outer membrane receptor for monomeric catechols
MDYSLWTTYELPSGICICHTYGDYYVGD